MNKESRQKCLSFLERTEFYNDEGEWRIAGSDWLLMSGSTLRSWTKVAEQNLGSSAKGIMYKTGKCVGEQFAKMLLKEGLKDEEVKCALEIFLTNGGWGKVQAKLNFQERKAVVRIRNSVTTRQTKAKEPVCHFISGLIAGALAIIFSKKAECVEIRCKAKGDTFCEFRVDGQDECTQK
jgi:predicted hydrocarbon binding protein